MYDVSILGAGSWGTAFAMHLARNGHNICLWNFNKNDAENMQKTRVNAKFLPEITLPQNITVSCDLHYSVTQAKYVMIAVPSHAFTAVFKQIPKPQRGL